LARRNQFTTLLFALRPALARGYWITEVQGHFQPLPPKAKVHEGERAKENEENLKGFTINNNPLLFEEPEVLMPILDTSP